MSDAKDAIEDEDVLVCDPDECAWEERCVTPPRYASCIESTIDARRCDAGYTEINLQCYQACGRNQCRV